MGFGDSLRAAEDVEWWKDIVATSSVVPLRPPSLRDWDEMRWDEKLGQAGMRGGEGDDIQLVAENEWSDSSMDNILILRYLYHVTYVS